MEHPACATRPFLMRSPDDTEIPLPYIKKGEGGHRTILDDRIVGTGVRLAHAGQGPPPIGRAGECRMRGGTVP